MKLKNRNFKSTLVLVLIITPLIASILISAIPNTNFNHAKQNDLILIPKSSAIQDINIATPENKTYTAPMSGYHPGSYGFENEDIGDDGDNIAFLDEYFGYTTQFWPSINIQNEKYGMKNILVMGDAQGSANTWGVHYIKNPQASGTIEFLNSFNDLRSVGSSTKRHYIYFRASDDTIGFRMMFELQEAKLSYHNGSSWQETATALWETWYQHSISFDCNAGTNGQFTWVIKNINGTELGRIDNIEFENDLNTIDEIYFGTNVNDYRGSTYWDAFGFSWDSNYDVGNNINEGLLLSYGNSTILEWMGYSLDGEANVTISGNTTILVPKNGCHTIQVFGNDSSGNIHESDVRYFFYGFINIITPENKTYTSPMSGYYPATLGFEDRKIPSDWTPLISASGCTVNLESSHDGHLNVIKLHDSGNFGQASIYHYLKAGSQPSGTIEFFMYTTDATDRSHFWVGSDVSYGQNPFVFGISEDQFYYQDSSEHYISGLSALDNTWYHIRIDFRGSGGPYQGLSANYKWKVFINGMEYGEFDYKEIYDVGCIWLRNANAYYNFDSYWDAFGFSWDPNYQIGHNKNEGLLLSYENSTNLEWIGYSLDGKVNITIQGNTTIPMPYNDFHSIQVFGNDSNGNWYVSNFRYFTVNSTLPIDTTIYVDYIKEYGLYFEILLSSPGYFLFAKSESFFPLTQSKPNSLQYYWFGIFNASWIEDDSILISVKIRIYYDPEDVIIPAFLALYKYDESDIVWLIQDQTVLDEEGNYLEIILFDLSYFCIVENPVLPPMPPDVIIIIIIILSVVAVSVPSTYTIISRENKKKKTGFKSISKVDTGYRKGPMPDEYKVEEFKKESMQHQETSKITPDMLTPIGPKKSLIQQKQPKYKNKDKKKVTFYEPIDIQKEIEEIREVKKTEREMTIQKQADRCQVHKGLLTGLAYVCPKCQTKYCVNCATSLAERNEGCWVCYTPIKIELTDNKRTNGNKIIDNSKLHSLFDGENIIEKISEPRGINVTLLSEDFFKKLEELDWDEIDKQEFIKEMLALTPEKRENILEEMIEKSRMERNSE